MFPTQEALRGMYGAVECRSLKVLIACQHRHSSVRPFRRGA